MQHPRMKSTTKVLQPPPLRTILATDNKIIILLAALQHYPQCGCHQGKLTETIPIIQGFIQRLYEQLPARKDRIEGQ